MMLLNHEVRFIDTVRPVDAEFLRTESFDQSANLDDPVDVDVFVASDDTI